MTDPRLALLRALALRDLSRTDPDDAVEGLDLLADAIPVDAPPPSLRARLLGALAAEPLAPLAVPLASLFEVGEDRARAYLAEIAGERWETMAPGVALLHFDGGPGTAGADVGFVRVDDDLDFPFHEHTGEERNLVLRGQLVDDDGQVYRAGDTFVHGPGSRHTFRSQGGLIFAVVVWGVDFAVTPDA